MPSKPVLVLGASGYVGSRLVVQLLQRGYAVRAAGRSLERLRHRPWSDHPAVELVSVEMTNPDSLLHVCRGCQVAYYLIHSMLSSAKDFRQADRVAARNMTDAAERAGLGHMIYLGGLGDDDPKLSEHLRSRIEVGRLLQSGSVPVTILRAAMIIGSGSGSFEILRYLANRLPVMITPRWVRTRSEPIAISNVLYYLIGCMEQSDIIGKTLDIGGPEQVSYKELFDKYCEQSQRRRRWMISVPILSPRLSSYWIGLVTPVPAALAKPLVLGLKNDVTCGEHEIREIMPQELICCREAIRRSLDTKLYQYDTGREILWHEHPEWSMPGDPTWTGGKAFRKWIQRITI